MFKQQAYSFSHYNLVPTYVHNVYKLMEQAFDILIFLFDHFLHTLWALTIICVSSHVVMRSYYNSEKMGKKE